MAFHVFSSSLATVTLLPWFFDSGDIMAVDLFTPDGSCNISFTSFTIMNS